MKVVILAGGLGTRMAEESQFRPKPMVTIGGKPILWHIMKTFSMHGYNEFIVCTGYKGDQIREYFLNYKFLNSDFTVHLGSPQSITVHNDLEEQNWSVTVAETGPLTPTGGRISKIRNYIGDEPFFCTYGDGVADIDLHSLVETHKSLGRTATVSITRPESRFGLVMADDSGFVTSFDEKPKLSSEVSIGYFVFEPLIFEMLNDDSILEKEPLGQLAEDNQLSAFRHKGFWQAMDTVREASKLNELWESGEAPWKIW